MALYLITPLMGWTWPSLLPLVLAVAAGKGYQKLTSTGDDAWLKGRITREIESMRKVSVPVDELVEGLIGEEVGRDERLIFEKDDTRLIFRRDTAGKFFVDILGPKERSARALRDEALAFVGDLVQQFSYNRVLKEMDSRGIQLVQENVDTESGDIILEVKRYR
ncbi:TPA: hypothetical protein DDW35_01980 [Candidatus Sumerlaeota bacterium]|jgi:hypothetical protein|nr:hypothetical protein [Candidatus Sumerlaeota bacterium]